MSGTSRGCVTSHCWLLVYCAIVTTGHTVFRRMSRTSQWCGTLHCRLLVAGSLEAAYSLNWGAREIWGKGGGETLALL